MTDTSTLIRLEDVEKIYQMGDVTASALAGASLSIYPKEFVAIMGPSGSGKSTLMNMVGCLDTPTGGKIFLEQQDISKLGESRLAQLRGQKIGFVFQQFNLIGTLTALENVALPMLFQSVSQHERRRRAAELLELVDLSERLHHRPSELSGGQQQRVALARALANDPEVILADEPTGNLDSKTEEAIMALFQKLNKDGTTIIIVTHEKTVARHAQRIIHIQDGVIVGA